MNDPLKARLAKLQKFSESAKRRANLYSDIAKMDDSKTASSLGALQKAFLDLKAIDLETLIHEHELVQYQLSALQV